MSYEPTHITKEILEYLYRNFSVEDEFLKQLKRESLQLGMPDITISPEQGAFLQFLIKSTGTKNILEIGSLGGYSAITMAKALPKGGHLIAVEQTLFYCDFIRNKAKQAGLNNIEVINKQGIKFLKEYDGKYIFDLIFVDADKNEYREYFDLSEKYLKNNGIFIADNALAFGQIANLNIDQNKHDLKDIESIREFNLYLRNRNDYFTILLPIGDGFLIALKK